MLEQYFTSFYNLITNDKSNFTKVSFWNYMIDAWAFPLQKPIIEEPPWEIATLPLYKSIEELFPDKYPPQYWEEELDVLRIGVVRYNTVSYECDERFSVISNFGQNCSKLEAIQVVERSKQLCKRYEKLIPFV